MIVTPVRFRLGGVGIGLLCLVLAAVISAAQPQSFFRAYLIGYSFWLALSIGCLGLAFIQFLTGGVWGLVTRRIFEAGATCLPLLALLFLPVLAGMPTLYNWTQPESDLAQKRLYLNVPFFVARAVVYFGSWLVLAQLLRRYSLQHAPVQSIRRLSIIGLLVLSLTVSFAAIDWWMSLEPTWFSTMYPAIICASDLLLAMAFAVLLLAALATRDPLRDVLTPRMLNDVGSLLLAFVMLWAYVTYFQYVLIWAGNLSDEITWYTARTEGGWQPTAWVIAGAGFLLPFWCLLFRGLKRNRRWLGSVAALIIATQLLHVYWLIQPAFSPTGPDLDFALPLVWIGVGGLWLAMFAWSFGAAPLVAEEMPALEAAHAGI